jgi:Chain length determinant protein
VNNPPGRAMQSRSSTAIPPRVGGPALPPDPAAPFGEIDQPAVGIFEPPNNFIVDAIRFHKLLVAAFAVACALIGAGLGLARQPVYTASATLQVGEVNPNSPGFGSYTESTTALATAFSRSIVATPVLGTIQRKLGLAPADSASRLSAEPIPLSPVFRVIATGPTAKQALGLANVTAGAVVAYVTKSNSSSPQATSLLRAYRHAALDFKRAKSRQETLENDGSSPETLLQAEAAQSTAAVKLEAISRSYVAAITSQSPRSGLVSVLAGATTASDDRDSKLQLFAFLGLLVGLALGCAAAVWRERRLATAGPGPDGPARRPD